MLRKIILLIFFTMLSNIPAQYDVVQHWLMLGTFPNQNTADPLATAFIENETSLLPARDMTHQDLQWRIAEADQDGKIDFLEHGFEQTENVGVYTHVYLFSEKAQLVKIWLGSDDGIALFFNGALVFSNPVWRGWAPGQDVLSLRLRKGWNRLLFKIVNGVGDFAFSARLTDLQGNPLSGARYKLDNPYEKEHALQHQSWLICEDICLANHFIIEDDQFYLPFTVRLTDLGSEFVGETHIILSAVDTSGRSVFEQKWKIKRSENEDLEGRFNVRQLLKLLKKGEIFRIQLAWLKNRSETEIILNREEIFEALLHTTDPQIPEKTGQAIAYYLRNRYWADFFTKGNFRIPSHDLFQLTTSFFEKDWAVVNNVFTEINDQLRLLAKEMKQNTIHFAGNAHIDMAWLWKFEETVQVCYETFRSALDFADKYPNFVYTQSQSQAYWWMENRFPGLFEEIEEKVRKGQWEIIGGMWVEPDLNLPSGESLVRQLLYGKRYFMDRFGVDVKVGYNVDSFGYCWTLPQIFKKAGIDAFVTQKITWNDTNEFPHKIFWWRGLDGSRVLSVFPFTYVHNGEPKRVASEFIQHKEITDIPQQLVLYGVGNHGGGPTQKNIDNIHMMQSTGVFPQVKMSTVKDVSDIVLDKYRDLPVWNDELYLEYHRGTYTSQARTKKNNRLSEIALESAEKLTVISGIKYPIDELNEAWRLTMFNQFHDILPGSSIPEVYDDADVQYATVSRLTDRIIDQSMDRILASLNHQQTGIAVLLFNPLSWERSDPVQIDIPKGYHKNMGLFNSDQEEIGYHLIDDHLLLSEVKIPACGYTTVYLKNGRNKEITSGLKVSETSLENDFLLVEINPHNGNISRLYDKKNEREVLAAGSEGNVLEVFEDIPHQWDAWNLGYTGKMWTVDSVDHVQIIADNAQKVGLRIIRSFGNSKFVQDLILYLNLNRLDIENQVNWNEEHVLLKAAFQLNVDGDSTTYEIPYGVIRRSNIAHNSIDSAKFEVSGHKWIDLSENDQSYGVSLLNNCKYGFDVKDNKMRITLLRSPKWPDPHADMGRHRFVYSVYPHRYGWQEGGTYQAAYQLNYPVLSRSVNSESSPAKRPLPAELSYVSVDQPNIIISAIKKAEDNDDIVIRLYETDGIKSTAMLALAGEIESVAETDLIERDIKNIKPEGRRIRLVFAPYEIKTVRVRLQ